ncbi:amino acid ABC transporter ATP-binding/permease protein [Staphylococcus warneri]|uniref:Amino acid ABC transporter ATP-binding/permease protein n=2 Tax=Staphylococcus TaxID=1279 RepID=A0A8B2ZK78_STAWA|nr:MULTISPECIES: amino acid ABC transporter ATP-binding/permease protein [Staphylococcus]EGG96076.1 ABC transporter, ATP-binding protein [Staphylococcus warneri VCU121]KKI61280.1 Transport ATP-binding protein CydC [Staphylococcus warneri]KTW23613.1 cysteine ABC transporter ATP-binding protein [Staphylococcus warneri]MBF2177689.1 amino acid ABC transporter ATP-binding/permease protein [Staphylococcus warneri]MBF2180938.1 amino acid ABC transporter ATP-binding/permease protein [Staphylococcus wa
MKSQIRFTIDKDLVIAIIIGIIGSLVALAMFFLSGYMVTQSALGAPLYALMVLVVSVKLFGFLRAIARYYERLYSHRTTFTMLRNVRVQFFQGLVKVIPDVYRKFNSSDLISRMVSRVEALQNIYLRVYYPPIVIGMTAIIAMCVYIFLSPAHAALIAVSMIMTLWVVPLLSSKRALKLKQIVKIQQSQFLTRFYDYRQGYQELQRFNKETSFKNDVLEQLQTFDHLQKKEQRFLTIYDYILNIIAMVSIFSTLYLGAIQIQSQTLDVVYLTSIVLMVLTLFEQAVPMSNVAYYKADTDQSLYDINEVIQYDDIKKVKNSHVNDESAPLFELNNVTFKYENQETPVLNRISFNVYQGERIAIIGPSGSGKSTLLQVMLGLYQVQEGSVIYNQSDIFRIEDESKYSDINALLQSQQLFDGTIKDNLLTDCNEDKIQHVLNSLDLSHLSLEEYITMDGETLSGGEIQRLSIARLLLKTKAKIWMLDEPTTGLDIEHTVQMMHLLLKQVETMIVSTHDLRLLPDFDRIIVMIDGEIKEQGSYETLIQNRGYLYQMEQLNQ